MANRKNLVLGINAIRSLKNVTNAYQQIANMRTKQIKESVEITRQFLNGIAAVYINARRAYLDQTNIDEDGDLRPSKASKSTLTLKKNGKSLSVLLTANNLLYGEILHNLWDFFIADLRQSTDEVVIVGTFGRDRLQNEPNFNRKVTYFDLDDDKPDPNDINKVIKFIRQYQHVTVFHAVTTSITEQIPVKVPLTGEGAIEVDESHETINYLFDPSSEAVLEFFESEIVGVLFQQRVYEHQLSRFSSRRMAMLKSTDKAKEELVLAHRVLRAFDKTLSNRKLMEIFASKNLWVK